MLVWLLAYLFGCLVACFLDWLVAWLVSCLAGVLLAWLLGCLLSCLLAGLVAPPACNKQNEMQVGEMGKKHYY